MRHLPAFPRTLFRLSLVAVLGVAVLGATLALQHKNDDYAFFDELIEVKQAIALRYVDKPDEARLREGAIQGMVDALNDPYTVYVPASGSASFNKDLTGEYAGIGAQVSVQNGWLTIVTPLEDSPAYRAGLMADDRIVEVDGQSTEGKGVDQCVGLLTGKAGSQVRLTIERKGKRLEFTLTRENIKTRSVKGVHRLAGDPNNWDFMIDPARKIAYIRMTQFTPDVSKEIDAALRSVGADTGELKGLVLDLRFNPGGLLNEAEAIADFFLKDGVIVSTRGRAFPEQVRRAEAAGTYPDFPIALLINGQSASASEVLSGALTENHRAIAVGTRSFGKGSVQSVFELPSGKGSELKITEQGYYLPSGRSISRKDDSPTWGVDPTEGFYVPMTDEETIAMAEARRKAEVLTPAGAGGEAGAEEKWSDPDWILGTLKDPQLSAAVRAIREKIAGGEWKPVGEPGPQAGKIEVAELQKARLLRDRMERELERLDRRIDAMEAATPKQTDAPAAFWSADTDITGGTIEVRDKDGKVIATLAITGNDVERWLHDATVKKK